MRQKIYVINLRNAKFRTVKDCIQEDLVEFAQAIYRIFVNNQNIVAHLFSQEDLDKEFDYQPINGNYKHNLCYMKCNNCNFKYLQPPWFEYICVDCENKNCDKKKKDYGIQLNGRHKKVYGMYKINKFNPEKFDTDDDCSYEAQKYNFDKYCIKYFQGICPHHRFQKLHKNWEDIKDIGEFQNLEDQVIKPCIKYDEIKNKYVLFLCKRIRFNQ